ATKPATAKTPSKPASRPGVKPAPATDTPAGAAPNMRTPTARIDRRGRLSVRAACPAGAAACKGRWSAAVQSGRRGRAFDLRAGRSRRWRLKLRPAERRALRRARHVTFTVAPDGVAPWTRAVTLRVARR
ncbi:MAG TPA: hypothetical protein VF533_10725, partial [Solirubrobacteraceae bacterium]